MRNCTRRRLLRSIALAALPLAAAGRCSIASPLTLDLSDLEARHGGRLGINAKSGTSVVTWRSQERFPYCSTFKVFLAACVMQRVQSELEKLNREVPITEADLVPHAPVTGRALGSTLTINALLKAAVEVSDNSATNILLREIGGLPVLRDWYHSIGDFFTRVDRTEVSLNSAIPGDPRDTTSPAQFVMDLEHVLLGQLLTPAHQSLLEHWLIETPTSADRIKAAVPRNYIVGHKTGTGANGTCNDIGIVWPPSSDPIILAVFFTGARDAAPKQLEAIVAEASRRALAALGHA